MRTALAGAALAAAVALSASLGVAVAQKEGEKPRCRGEVATIVGTAGDDVIMGTETRDVIVAGPGDDEIYGGRGSDILCGGPGEDLIQAGRGNDTVDAGPGDRDRAIGGHGDDLMTGGPGDFDEVAGSLGIDTISGGPGDFDLVHGDYGYDRIDGGPGRGDIASFATAAAAGRGGGVWVSLPVGKARGDGHDRLYRIDSVEGSAFADRIVGDRRANVLDGGPGDDTLLGGGGTDELRGGQGSDRCRGEGTGVERESCGPEEPPEGGSYVQIDGALGGGGGLAIVGGAGDDVFTGVAYDEEEGTFGVGSTRVIALGPGCKYREGDPRQAVCDPEGPARWVIGDLGPGDDRLRVVGSLAGAQNVRFAGGPGDDVIRGGPEDDLVESGRGSDRLYGGDGEDALVGGLPGPTYLYGQGHDDLLAAGGGCAGGALVGGEGRDNGSFAETQAHPGLLYISLARGRAWIDVLPASKCPPVRLDKSIEDIEGSFDNDVLIGDARDNGMLGQPGQDRFYGGGGDDVIDARDDVRDFVIDCGGGKPFNGRGMVDPIDPAPRCDVKRVGEPVPGLNNPG